MPEVAYFPHKIGWDVAEFADGHAESPEEKQLRELEALDFINKEKHDQRVAYAEGEVVPAQIYVSPAPDIDEEVIDSVW